MSQSSQGKDKGRLGKISPSLPGNLLLLLPALPPSRSGWQGPHQKRGMSAMRTREKGEMEVNPCIRPPLTRGSGRQGKGNFRELWYRGSGILGDGHLPMRTTVPPGPGRLQSPSHGTARALLGLLGRRTKYSRQNLASWGWQQEEVSACGLPAKRDKTQ